MIEPHSLSVTSNQLENTITKLLNTFNQIPQINSQQDEEKLNCIISELLEYLPRTFTAQQIMGIDSPNQNIIDFIENQYGEILNELVLRFNSNWPYKLGTINPIIEQVFTTNGMYLMVHESILTLINALKAQKNLNIISYLIEQVLGIESLFASISYICFNYNEPLGVKWNEFLQVLVSIPSRVFNCFQGSEETPSFFQVDNYTNHLLQVFLHVFEFIAQAQGASECLNIEYSVLSSFLNKLCTIGSSEDPFSEVIAVFNILLKKPDSVTFHRVSIIQKVLKDLNRFVHFF